MNPFSLKAAPLLAPHAQHPALVHFPVVLFLASVAFDWLAIWRRRDDRPSPAPAGAARANLFAAGLGAPLTLLSGLAAWRWQLEGAGLRGNLRLHLLGALASTVLIGVLCLLRAGRQPGGRSASAPTMLVGGRTYFALGLLTVVLIVLTGHPGGFLSGVNQAGVPS